MTLKDENKYYNKKVVACLIANTHSITNGEIETMIDTLNNKSNYGISLDAVSDWGKIKTNGDDYYIKNLTINIVTEDPSIISDEKIKNIIETLNIENAPISITKIGDWNRICKYEEDIDWFSRADLSAYAGKYIATIGKEVVAYGDNVKIVWEEAKKKFPRGVPILAKIPKEDLLIL